MHCRYLLVIVHNLATATLFDNPTAGNMTTFNFIMASYVYMHGYATIGFIDNQIRLLASHFLRLTN